MSLLNVRSGGNVRSVCARSESGRKSAVDLFPIILVASAFSVSAQSLTANLPAACAACKGPEPHIGTGTFRPEAKRLLTHPLPHALISDVREEPWIFRLTVNVDGTPCAVLRKGGPDGVFVRAFVTAVMKWRFIPLIHKGNPTCYTSTLYCYVKRQEGRAILVIPGVTEPY